MGWVKNRLQERVLLPKLIEPLWNELRDSLGLAVREYNDGVRDTNDTIEVKDCESMGKYCRRVSKHLGNKWLEIYVNEELKRVSHRGSSGQIHKICEYRLSADHFKAEFVLNGNAVLSAESVSERALEHFLFPSTGEPKG